MRFLIVLFLTVNCCAFCQTLELKNEKLIKYYELINKAENDIVNNNLTVANTLYKQAFISIKEPYAKDLYNSMQVALKINDINTAYTHYSSLKCLDYPFDKDFLKKHFNGVSYKEKECSIKFDIDYKKILDSLHIIDQSNRNLAKGDYTNYQKEITKDDSITSINLLKLIQEKGFPNEYNIGISFKGDVSFQKFYLIIWHQLAENRYSSQQINFSEELNKALNQGKISPENAAFLYDLSNGTTKFSSPHFEIMDFLTNNGSLEPFNEQILNKTNKTDCCYVHVWFFPKNRNDDGKELVTKINNNRKNIGMSDLDSELDKKIFLIKNEDYIFPRTARYGSAMEDIKSIEMLKKHFIKLNDSPN